MAQLRPTCLCPSKEFLIKREEERKRKEKRK
jgi:hypothetical protein